MPFSSRELTQSRPALDMFPGCRIVLLGMTVVQVVLSRQSRTSVGLDDSKSSSQKTSASPQYISPCMWHFYMQNGSVVPIKQGLHLEPKINK